jgi:hypothetical protein
MMTDRIGWIGGIGRIVNTVLPILPVLPMLPGIFFLRALIVVAASSSGVHALAQRRDATLEELLQRAGTYVRGLEDDFSSVIGDEEYEQKDVLKTQTAGGGKTRRMRSEMSFMRMQDDGVWLSIRNVLRLDGAPVADSKARLDAALADHTPGRASQLRRLRDEGARFNIGRIGRNFSDPMLGLLVVDPGAQPRFTFMLAGTERVRGVNTVRLSFVEHARPTLISRGSDKQDLPAHGDVWIDPSDGVVHQTRLITDDSKFDTRATITVMFSRDRRLDRWLPVRMDESYVQQGLTGGSLGSAAGSFLERIECVATYSNYRRFETSARVLPQ